VSALSCQSWIGGVGGTLRPDGLSRAKTSDTGSMQACLKRYPQGTPRADPLINQLSGVDSPRVLIQPLRTHPEALATRL
jgi:hypothetical protein